MPIIADKTFKASLKKILEGEPDFKRAKGNAQDWPEWSYAVAKYYSPEIERANTALENLRDTAAARVKTAFDSKDKRRALLGALGARLEYYGWAYHCSLAAANWNRRPNPTQAEVDRLHTGNHRNSMAMHACQTCTDQFVAYLTSVITHVNADWNDIRAIFFPQWELMQLEQISMTGSDSHKEGKSVLILVFKVRQPLPAAVGIGAQITNFVTRQPTSLVRLVYKPSDLALDYLMVADTHTVAAANPGGLPNSPGGSLLENINTLIQGHLNPDQVFVDGGRDAPVLPTYPILPRNRGNITTAYGYIKFLQCLPKPDEAFEHVMLPRNAADSDWITDNTDDLIDYYRIFGWYIAIAVNFGIADAHNQNLIVHRKKAHLIDLEISFKERCESVGNTGLGDAMIRGLGQQHGDKNHMFYYQGGMVKWTTGARAAHYINAALSEAFELIRQDPGNALRGWLGGADLAGTVARYTPRATKDFGEALRSVYASGGTPATGGVACCLCPKPAPRANPPVPIHGGFPRDGGAKKWYEGGETNHRPNYVLNDAAHDFADYLKCDYPVYYRRLDGMHLLNARGNNVVVRQPLQTSAALHANRNRSFAGVAYFDHYPAIFLFEFDLGVLRLERDFRSLLFEIPLRQLKFTVDLATIMVPASHPPTPVTAAHLNANLLADLGPTFGANHAALTAAAVATVVTPGSAWRVNEGAKVYVLELEAGTTRVHVHEVKLTVPGADPAVPVTPVHLDTHVVADLRARFAAAQPAINLGAAPAEAAITAGSEWQINDPSGVYYLRLERTANSDVLKVYRTALTVPNTVPAQPNTPAHLDAHLIADLTPSLGAANPAINLNAAAAAVVKTAGKEWVINDVGRTFYIQHVTSGRQSEHERLKVWESQVNVPLVVPAVPVTPDHLDANSITDLRPVFANAAPPIVLAATARAETQKDGQSWRIINEYERRYYIELVPGTMKARVFRPDTAIAMVASVYSRMRTDANYRAQLLANAQAFVSSKYPRQDVQPLFDGF